MLVQLVAVGCSHSGSQVSSFDQPNLLLNLPGLWQGSGHVSEGRSMTKAFFTMSIGRREALLEVVYGATRVRARVAAHRDADGKAALRILSKSVDPPGLSDFVLQGLFIEVEPEQLVFRSTRRTQHGGIAAAPAGTTMVATGLLRQPRAIPERPTGSGGPFLYDDWSGPSAAGPSGHRERLTAAFAGLATRGWRCLSQVSGTLPTSGPLVLRFSSPPGVPAAYLVFAPDADDPVAFKAYGRPGAAKRFHGPADADYPVVVSARGGETNFELSHLPRPGSLARVGNGSKVIVFALGSTPGDRGTGCTYEGTNHPTAATRFELLTAVFASVALEGTRRRALETDQELLRALATLGRDKAVESALSRIAPDATPETIAFFTRWAVLVLSNDVSTMSFFRDNAREYILQMIQRERPEMAQQSRLIDLIVDLHLQKGALSR